MGRCVVFLTAGRAEITCFLSYSIHEGLQEGTISGSELGQSCPGFTGEGTFGFADIGTLHAQDLARWQIFKVIRLFGSGYS